MSVYRVSSFCLPLRSLDRILNSGQIQTTGPDGVSATMLKCTATSIAPSVTQLFNLSTQSGKVPTEWKQSLVVPITKSSDLSSPNNYHPISLLSILSKLLERHINMHRPLLFKLSHLGIDASIVH